MVFKIPATMPGLQAITAVIASGAISVNVTLIFSQARYRQVHGRLPRGPRAGPQRQQGPGRLIHSVASFFVSRGDTEIDARLEKIGTPGGHAGQGQRGIANARLAYQHYERMLASPRWQALAQQVLRDLEAVGVDYGDVTEGLESSGLAAFDASWRDLGDQIAARLRHPEEGRTTGVRRPYRGNGWHMTEPSPYIDVPNLPAPAEGIVVTMFITVRSVARSRDFDRRVLGGTVVLEENPCIVKLSNSWILMNPGGPPTPDKPGISVVNDEPGDTTSIFLNLRVADIQACYEEWKSKGAEFVTPAHRPRGGNPLLPPRPGWLPDRSRPGHGCAARPSRPKAPGGPPGLSFQGVCVRGVLGYKPETGSQIGVATPVSLGAADRRMLSSKSRLVSRARIDRRRTQG